MRIGEMLVAAGVVSQDHVKSALEKQQQYGGRLATILLTAGLCDEPTLAYYLSRQLGVPFVVLSRSAVPLELLKSFPLEIASKLMALPIHLDDRELFMAMADPKSIAALDELRFVTGYRIVEHGALFGHIEDTIREAYGLLAQNTTVFWEGANLDPKLDLGSVGNLEIVIGRGESEPEVVAATQPVDISIDLDSDEDWKMELETSGSAVEQAVVSNKQSIMVVDDEPEIRNMLSIFLNKAGYEVWEVPNGSEALKKLQATLPDAIILDAMLPGVHGFDICSRIKKAEATKHIPVVMISAVYRGWRYADDVRRTHGADHFMEKPLKLAELKHILEATMAKNDPAISTQEISARAAVALQKASQMYREGDLMGAAHQLQQAVEAAPFTASLQRRLGMLYDKLGETYRAIAALERAVELEPEYSNLLQLARLYEKTGFHHKAYEAWERCLRNCDDPKLKQDIRTHMSTLLEA